MVEKAEEEELPLIKGMVKPIPPQENPFRIDLPNQPRVYTEVPVLPEETRPEQVANLDKFIKEVTQGRETPEPKKTEPFTIKL